MIYYSKSFSNRFGACQTSLNELIREYKRVYLQKNGDKWLIDAALLNTALLDTF